MDVRRFREDLQTLAHRACEEDDEETRAKVFRTVNMLAEMHRRNLVKINHSALELVCAHGLIREGYDVKVEHRLDRALVCDVYGARSGGTRIVEIETGFIPPEAALRPRVYVRSRIASKIARYSRFASKFTLGTTPSYVLDVPRFFILPSRLRSRAEAAELKSLTDIYYDDPAISIEELMRARVHSIFIIDVDSASTRELDPGDYLGRAAGYRGRDSAEELKAFKR